MNLNIANTFTSELPADSNLENSRRQVAKAVFSYTNPKKTKAPKVSLELWRRRDSMTNCHALGLRNKKQAGTI